MSIQNAWQASLNFFQRRVVVEPSQGDLTSDAGLLPLREFDERIGLTDGFVAVLEDHRNQSSVRITLGELTRARVYGILAGYEDQNDHDTLRCDPVFKLIAGRCPTASPLASQPTHSRFENSIRPRCLLRLRSQFIDQYLQSFVKAPARIVLDLDAVADPAHGMQQLTFWHGFYDQNQYLPLIISCGTTDQIISASLRHGVAPAALAADARLEEIVTSIRQQWPDVEIIVRADAGFSVPAMYHVCERLRLTYTFGLSTNPRLQRQTEQLAEEARQRFEDTGENQRLFTGFWYQANSWPGARWVIAKCEVNPRGTNIRFIVTNRPGAPLLLEATYDEYVARGESENRNKELKCGLAMDRLSDHRFMANQFRLYLHVLAMNLLVRLRQHLANPPAPLLTEYPAAEKIPAAALTGRGRRHYFNRRRTEDPLGEAQPNTWRTLLIKVAAEIIVTTRRVLVRLSKSWPHHHYYQQVCSAVQRL